MQLWHIVRDASVEIILAADTMMSRVAQSGVTTLPLRAARDSAPIDLIEGFQQIIYTSGTTGQPKGVRHGARQIAWSMQALTSATGANEQDSYLSVLPLPLLLETICAIFIPTLVGGSVHFATEMSEAVGRGAISGLADVIAAHNPTATVIVPELLRVWIAELTRNSARAPSRLRFVAVGGAPVPTPTADVAWSLGIPVHEGYGLSECCSVVSLNRIGERVRGTVGRPLEGLDVRIANGEIVVDGPTLTDGYVGRSSHTGPWRTGDLGSIETDGSLRVLGRKDNVLVTSLGRNVSPEWIETMLLADPRVALCSLVDIGEADLAVMLVPSPLGVDWFAKAKADEVANLVQRNCVDAPDYATPKRCFVVPLREALDAQLLTANGRLRRKPITEFTRAKAMAALSAAT
jgi:long-subunit acyl-CoA synthetase (AMP-forming)